MSTHNIDLIKEMFTFPFSDYFCVSEFVKSEIEKFCKPFVNLKVLPNCVSKEYYNISRTKRRVDNFFCNARISKEKGVSDLLDVWREFLKTYPEKKLFLTGGSFNFLKKDKIKDKIKSINKFYPGSITVFKNLFWKDIPGILKTMDCLLIKSKMESFGLAALEGMASRIFIISTNAGNLKYLLNGVTNTLDINDNKGFLKEMINIVSEKSSYNSKLAYNKSKKYFNVFVANNFIKDITK